MHLGFPIAVLLICCTAPVIVKKAHAQVSDVDCEDQANRDNPDCLGLPDDQQITNFVPLVGPLLGAAALAVVGGSAGSTVSTTSTTSTTN